MKTAVIVTGGHQYVVQKDDQIKVELLNQVKDKVEFDVMLVIDGDKTTIGTPLVEGVKVKATIVDHAEKQDKVVAIRYKAKKRVHKRKGHRQQLTVLKIDSIG